MMRERKRRVYKGLVISSLLLLFSWSAFSQQYRWRSKPQHTWIFGLGFQAIDDYNVPFGDLFKGGRTWHLLPYPTRLSAERNFNYGIGVGGLLQYNQLKQGKFVNEVTNPSLVHVVSFDGYVKYRFNMKYKKVSWFDPYVALGLGYTMRFSSASSDHITTNIHLGSNFWFTDRIGVQIETSAKFALGASYPTHPASYLQHSASFLYRLYPSKRQKKSKQRYKWIRKKPKGNANRI